MIPVLLSAVALGAGVAPAAPPLGAEPAGPVAVGPPDPIRVVTTLSVYGSIVREIGGGEVEVTSIAGASEDAHFVRPKPSFALELRRGDLLVTTGLDLELWLPTLLDKAGNPRVMEGAPGYVATYPGIELLDVPPAASRSAGDVHIYGNPHLHTDPLRTLQIARNIAAGLKRVAPDRAALFERRLDAFADRLYRRLFGDALVELLGGETLEKLALSRTLFSFLEENRYEGAPLTARLGGWLAAAEPFRGKEIICYHKNWAYFEDRFQVRCADYVEVKPGIPPTPGHVAQLIEKMKSRNIRVLLAADYFDRGKILAVARRAEAKPVIVPLYPGGAEGLDTYFDLVDRWVSALATAFGAREVHP